MPNINAAISMAQEAKDIIQQVIPENLQNINIQLNDKASYSNIETEKTGTSIQSAITDDAMIEIVKIDGATTITKPNPNIDISPSNIATITNAKNFNIMVSNFDATKNNQFNILYELISLPSGIKDTIEKGLDGKLKYIKRVGKIVFNGTENWNRNVTSSPYFNTTTPIDIKANTMNILCTHFNTGVLSTNLNIKSGNAEKIQIRYDLFADVASFKSWLALNNITVYYELSTQMESIIPDIYLASYKGITNYYTTANPQVNSTINFKSKLWSDSYKKDLRIAKLETAIVLLGGVI